MIGKAEGRGSLAGAEGDDKDQGTRVRRQHADEGAIVSPASLLTGEYGLTGSATMRSVYAEPTWLHVQ